mmetsp:Transcript_41607/g.97688  ORF Transcript_41607/g.97688 Transcript_41607/m.97688 type:complete len:316 (-) Transcript_41607:3927-4874(-)
MSWCRSRRSSFRGPARPTSSQPVAPRPPNRRSHSCGAAVQALAQLFCLGLHGPQFLVQRHLPGELAFLGGAGPKLSRLGAKQAQLLQGGVPCCGLLAAGAGPEGSGFLRHVQGGQRVHPALHQRVQVRAGLAGERQRGAENGVTAIRRQGHRQQRPVQHRLVGLDLRLAQVCDRQAQGLVHRCCQQHRVRHGAVQQFHQPRRAGAGAQRQAQHRRLAVVAVLVLVGRHTGEMRLQRGEPGDLVDAVLDKALILRRCRAMFDQQLLGHALLHPGGFGQLQHLKKLIDRHTRRQTTAAGPGSAIAASVPGDTGMTTR